MEILIAVVALIALILFLRSTNKKESERRERVRAEADKMVLQIKESEEERLDWMRGRLPQVEIIRLVELLATTGVSKPGLAEMAELLYVGDTVTEIREHFVYGKPILYPKSERSLVLMLKYDAERKFAPDVPSEYEDKIAVHPDFSDAAKRQILGLIEQGRKSMLSKNQVKQKARSILETDLPPDPPFLTIGANLRRSMR